MGRDKVNGCQPARLASLPAHKYCMPALIFSQATLHTRRRASIPLDRLAASVAKTYGTLCIGCIWLFAETVHCSCRESPTTAAELLRLAAETCPDWCAVLQREGKEYFKVA